MRIRYFLICFTLFLTTTNKLFAQQDPVDLIASDTLGIPGSVIKIDISVNGFSNIISCQASINWDPKLLAFDTVSNFGLKDFGIDDFGMTTSEQGHVRFLWTPDDALPVTVADGTILFTATFEVISEKADTATISFKDTVSEPEPYEIEFADEGYNILEVYPQEGTVAILSSSSDLVNITSTPNTSCDIKVVNGSLEADVLGNTDSYTFHWFAGTEIKETPDFEGSKYEQIPDGDYTLQVLDKDGEIFVEKKSTSVLKEPLGTPDTVSEINNSPQTSCSEDEIDYTGMIEIDVNGEQSDNTYNISWWKGDSDTGEELTTFANAYVAESLGAGTYEVVVENPATTCKSYFSISITEDLVEFDLSLTSTENNFCENGANGSATSEALDADGLSLSYFWFMENDIIDTTKALAKGATYENIIAGTYKSYVMDLDSKCDAQDIVTVGDDPIFPEPVIKLSNDTIFANSDDALWRRDEILINFIGPYLLPTEPGWYSFDIANEYNCAATSEKINFMVTGLEDLETEISIYPNPFIDYVRISNLDGKLDFIKVFDSQGVLLQEFFDIKQQFTELHLSSSPDGIYLLKIRKDQKTLTRKIVKNHTK